MKEGPAKIAVQGGALCLASLTLALAGTTIPVAGVFFAILTPLPLILLSARLGRATALLGVLAVGLCLAFLLGRGYAWIFYLEFGLPALVLAEAIRREWAPELSVGAGSLVVIAGSLLALFILSRGSGVTAYLLGQIDVALQEAMALYSRIGFAPEESGALSATVQQLQKFLLETSPGLFIAVALLTTSVNYFLARTGSSRASTNSGADTGFAWKMPDALVWVFIASAALLLSGLPIVKQVGMNGLVVMMTLYFLQGLAIAAFWIRRLKLPAFVRVLGVLLLLLQPLLLLLLTGVGLFDIWFPFRRQTFPRQPGA
jgi:uncharacterized protein YybS (DUF2232 family)